MDLNGAVYENVGEGEGESIHEGRGMDLANHVRQLRGTARLGTLLQSPSFGSGRAHEDFQSSRNRS